MTNVYNADEVLAMAEEIERNGRRFYLLAAEKASSPALKKLFADLAEWEEGHERLFRSMREAIPESYKAAALVDPGSEEELYLQAVASTHVFKLYRDVDSALASASDEKEALKMALTFERDSIAFFLGLVRVTPDDLGKAQVEELVRQEIGHVAHLQKMLFQLS